MYTAIQSVATIKGVHKCNDSNQRYIARKHDCGVCVALPGDVVNEEGPGRASVVAPCDGPEPLLTGRVPHLQLYRLAREIHHL